MQKSSNILKQPLWQKGLFLFISTLIVFKAGNCFSNDDIIFNNNYQYTRLLYENEEKARRIQLEQLQLMNERLVKRIKADYEKQQAEAKDKRYQEKILAKILLNKVVGCTFTDVLLYPLNRTSSISTMVPVWPPQGYIWR